MVGKQEVILPRLRPTGTFMRWVLGYNLLIVSEPDSNRVNESKSKLRNAWNWLLVVPALALAFPAIYSRPTPELFGFPFFYWYQIAWILISALITGIVYFVTENK